MDSVNFDYDILNPKSVNRCNLSNSNYETDYLDNFYYNPTPKKLFLIVYITLSIISIFGNLSLLYVIYLTKKTVVDFLIGGQRSTTMAISFTIVTLSCYKLWTVTRNSKTIKSKPDKKGVVLLFVLPWCLAVLFGFPYFFMRTVRYRRETCLTYCETVPNSLLSMDLCFTLQNCIEYYIPAIILIVAHSLIWCKIQNKNNVYIIFGNRSGNSSSSPVAGDDSDIATFCNYENVGDDNEDDQNEDCLSADRKEAMMMTSIATIFVFSKLPWHLLDTVLPHSEDFLFSAILFCLVRAAHVIEFVGVIAYPLVYFKMGSKFTEVGKRFWGLFLSEFRGGRQLIEGTYHLHQIELLN
ncbi:hypothetical protein HELRODRAFT_180797 [Helobdella robusta]|uniref:G-protein coupled receptors family 1 profile domain-containing protein n=1 Tax=Helobdella robusta TaxID=6412 RepID=T1FGA4_HELRO|nr:hypothetical protein HELRODRAFT_180797 [Helobdella robusta]ESN93481.1 hypothetical protein HELRODRAFT_180797 [Helobdella robusta]